MIHKKRRLCRPSKLSVSYGEPILVKKGKDKKEEKIIAEKLIQQVRNAMLSLRDNLQ